MLPEILELWNLNTLTTATPKKKNTNDDREMTTLLLMLRCCQMGISLRDLDLLTVGMVNDMAIERENDALQMAYQGYTGRHQQILWITVQ